MCEKNKLYQKKQLLTGQAVILAAGRGIRTYPLTLTKPKPLLKVAGKTILEYSLDNLTSLVEEVIIVVGYKKEMIQKAIGSNYKGLKIKYVFQKKLSGTGDAIQKAIPHLKNKFLLLNGDDLYEQEDIKQCLKKYPCILLKQVKNPENYGQVKIKNNQVKELVEKPKKRISNLVNTGLYVLDKSIFDLKIKKSVRNEYEITDYIKNIIENEKLYFHKNKSWIPVSYSWNLLDANEYLLKNYYTKNKVIIGKGTIIESGANIQGPVLIGQNCFIGANSYIKKFTSIGDNCAIGQAVEIENTVIGDNNNIGDLTSIKDSVVGDNCKIGAGTIFTNFRDDGQTIKSVIAGKIIDTKRQRLGAIVGDGVRIGINSLIMPGKKIWAGKTIKPNQTIKKDII
ncbi:MAG: NTP transferase domain-containing protein [Candidatus Pacebacteria bacterium]|nr:NTP transferase domain-containing protein [Candidatus Paceibacterota bacterium]